MYIGVLSPQRALPRRVRVRLVDAPNAVAERRAGLQPRAEISAGSSSHSTIVGSRRRSSSNASRSGRSPWRRASGGTK